MSAASLSVILLICLTMASGVVHKIQTQHHALSGEHSKHLFGHASRRHQLLYRRKVGTQASVGKLPLQDNDYLIVGAITVGTPPQSFNVEVDVFYTDHLFVIGANANLSSVNKHNPKKNTYNADNSSTYVAVNGNVSVRGTRLTGHKAQDVLSIGSLSATIKSFIVVDELDYGLNDDPIDGVLGLSPFNERDYDEHLNVSVVANDLIDQLDKPLISVYTNVTRYYGTGQVTLGAEDTDNCQSTWSYVPVVDYIEYDPYTVHGSSVELTIDGELTTVNLDSNVTFGQFMNFDAPKSFEDVFLNITGATYDESVGMFGEYTIDCNTTKAPLITLNLGGVGNSTDSTSRKLVLSGADYIRYRQSEDVCYIAVSFYGSDWYLGYRVLNNHCISYNHKERTVGFADSKTQKTDVKNSI